MPIPALRELELTPAVTVDGKQYINLLHTLTQGRELPEGCTHWGIRSVGIAADCSHTSSGGFTYPAHGWVDAPGPFIASNTGGCPAGEGDGICLAIQIGGLPVWEAVASGDRGAHHLLLAAYHHQDILGSHHTLYDADEHQPKIRLRRMRIAAYIDGLQLLADHWDGADLRGLEMELPGWEENLPVGAALMAGATHTQLLQAAAAITDSLHMFAYAHCLRNGITHQQALDLIGAGLDLTRRGDRVLDHYLQARARGLDHHHLIEAITIHPGQIRHYTAYRTLGDTHPQAITALATLHHSQPRISHYLQARRNGISHQQALPDPVTPDPTTNTNTNTAKARRAVIPPPQRMDDPVDTRRVHQYLRDINDTHNVRLLIADIEADAGTPRHPTGITHTPHPGAASASPDTNSSGRRNPAR